MKQTSLAKILLTSLTFASLAAGCSGSGNAGPTGPVTLNFWMPFETTDRIQPLIADYRKLHPNVNIVYSLKDINNYSGDLLNNLAAGTGPDIFAIHNDWLPQYLDKVTPAPAKTLAFVDFKNAFVDPVINDFSRNQKNIYGVAMSVDSLGLYYNKDLLGSAGIATPPKTWDELTQDVQTIRQSDGKGYFKVSGAALGTSSNINRAVDILCLFMLQQGTQAYNQDFTTPTFAEPLQQHGNEFNPGLTALNFYTSFADPTSLNYNWNMRSDYSIDAFTSGKAAFLYSYSYTRDTILNTNQNLNFDVAPVPQPNLDNPTVNFANYWGEVVSKQSKNAAVAWDFLNFITSYDELNKFYASHDEPASRRDLISLQIKNDPNIAVFANANLTAKTFYKPDQAKFDNIFGSMIDNVILGGKATQDALSQAEQQVATLTSQ